MCWTIHALTNSWGRFGGHLQSPGCQLIHSLCGLVSDLVDSGIFAQWYHYKKNNAPTVKIKSLNFTHSCFQEWIQENTVLDIVLRDSLHQPQYVEKLEKIIRFMIKEKALTLPDLDRIWNAQAGKHEAIVKNVHDLLAKLAWDFTPEQLDHLFECFQVGMGFYAWRPRGVKGRVQYEAIMKNVYRCPSYVSIYTVAAYHLLQIDSGLASIFGSSTTSDRSTMHPKFNPTRVATRDLQIMTTYISCYWDALL